MNLTSACPPGAYNLIRGDKHDSKCATKCFRGCDCTVQSVSVERTERSVLWRGRGLREKVESLPVGGDYMSGSERRG